MRKEEYCNNLRNTIRRKLGDYCKEWRRLFGCWYQMVDRAYAEYLGSRENEYVAHELIRVDMGLTWG